MGSTMGPRSSRARRLCSTPTPKPLPRTSWGAHIHGKTRRHQGRVCVHGDAQNWHIPRSPRAAASCRTYSDCPTSDVAIVRLASHSLRAHSPVVTVSGNPRRRGSWPSGGVHVSSNLARPHSENKAQATEVTDDVGLALADVAAVARQPSDVMEQRDVGREHGAQPLDNEAFRRLTAGLIGRALDHRVCPDSPSTGQAKGITVSDAFRAPVIGPDPNRRPRRRRVRSSARKFRSRSHSPQIGWPASPVGSSSGSPSSARPHVAQRST